MKFIAYLRFPVLLGLMVNLCAYAQVNTLRLAHFLPATAKVHTDFLIPWKESIEAQSNGSLQIELYPAQTLSKADKIYDATAKGLASIGVTAQGYRNGRFPLSQIVELPGIAQNSMHGSCILQKLYDSGALEQEYNDTHVLFMFTTTPALLHTIKKPIKSPSDLKGLRIRRPTAIAGEILQNLGASPISLTAPDIYTALQRGVIDGLTFPWEALDTFKLTELISYHTDLPLYTLSFVATMNKNTYDKLSAQEKEIIDAHSGLEWALKMGAVFDEVDAQSKQQILALGQEITAVEGGIEHPDWQAPLQQSIAQYLQQLGEEGEKVYALAQSFAQQCPTQ